MFNQNSLSSNNHCVSKPLTSKELEQQSPIKIDRWVDLQSEEAKEIDNNPDFTKMIIKMIRDKDHSFLIDEKGRIYCRGNGCYNPLHDEYFGKNIGYRIAILAAN